MTSVAAPYPYFTDAKGKALEGGKVYIGTAGIDPRTSPIAVYQDSALTISWAQPIRTVGGYPSYQGAPSNIYTAASSFSLLVETSRGEVVFRSLNNSDGLAAALALLAGTGGAAMIGLSPGGDVQDAITYVTPAMFGAVGDGVTDDTAELQAMIDWAYNSGNVRANIELPGNTTYLVSDPNADGYCLLLPDGVSMSGASALTSRIQTATAGKVILRRYRTGTARQGFLRDFCLDGTNVAKGCLELFGSAYDSSGGTMRCENALRPVVIDGTQNFTLRGCVALYAGEWSYSILNGAGTVELDNCYARFARYGHILIDNDPIYEGYQLGPAGGASALAYTNPTAISVRGGVYEDEHPTYPGELNTSIRVNTARRVLVYGNATLAIRPTTETIFDDGRLSFPAARASDTTFTVASSDVTSYFTPGRRVMMMTTSAAHYSMPYGTPTYLTTTTFQVSGNRTAIFTAGVIVQLVKRDGTAVTAEVASSAFSANTTVTVTTAVVPTDMVSARVGFAFGVVSSSAFATNTTVTMIMDSGMVVPTGLGSVETGYSDDSATSIWYSTNVGSVNGTRIRDATLSVAGAGFTGSSVRSGAYQSIYEAITFSGVQGDWFEISQQASVIRPFGSLTGGKLRVRHTRGINAGFGNITYMANQAANTGVPTELPGHAATLAYSTALSGRYRYPDQSGTWQVVPQIIAGAAIPAPTGGATIDAESRTAINAIRAALTAAGITL